MYKSANNKKLDDLNVDNNVTYAVLLQDRNDLSKYTKSSDNTWPKSNYTFNKNRSGCVDSNGNLVENILSFDDAKHLMSLSVTKSVKCYMYFDVIR